MCLAECGLGQIILHQTSSRGECQLLRLHCRGFPVTRRHRGGNYWQE